MLVKVGDIWVIPEDVSAIHRREINSQILSSVYLKNSQVLDQVFIESGQNDIFAKIINDSLITQSFGAPNEKVE